MSSYEIDWSDRFWSKVDPAFGFGPYGTCWKWIACYNKYGYGRFHLGGRNDGYVEKAHRLAYILCIDEIPSDKPCVLHICNNPPCCNPAHLYVGTQKDNMSQMARDGRHFSLNKPECIPRGDKHGNTKIPDAQLHEVFEMRAMGLSYQKISVKFGVSDVCIGNIITGKSRNPL